MGFWCCFVKLSCSTWADSCQALDRPDLGSSPTPLVPAELPRAQNPPLIQHGDAAKKLPAPYLFFFLLQGQAFVKRPFCSSERLSLGFIWLSLSYFSLFPKHKPYSKVSWLLGWHIILPLQLLSPILLESGVFTAHWLLPDKPKNRARLKPQHLQCS